MLTVVDIQTIVHLYRSGDYSRRGIARKLGISRTTVDKVLAQYEATQETSDNEALDNLLTLQPAYNSRGRKPRKLSRSIAAEIDRYLELNARDGFGLLSPTIYRHDGKTIAIGIVPDKLSGENNWNLGWAHCYSLPREWSLDASGELVQKPYSGLTGMRSDNMYQRNDFDLNGSVSLSPVEGREVELLGRFIVGTETFGFKVFKNGSGEGSISYNPNTGELIADFSRLTRLVNDGGVYNGIYRCSLPEFQRSGAELKLNVFIDHSIVDIFINDRWATSIRVFPTDADASGITAYSTGNVKVKEMHAWTLSKTGSSGAVSDITADDASDAAVDVYNLQGIAVRNSVARAEATEGLPRGIYIVGGRKVIVK